jgi:hypothetical protein
MAHFQINTAPADPVRPYLEGVAKSLVDRLYGPDGPAWGTKLSTIEDTILAVRQLLSEQLLAEALQRQAVTAPERPAAWQRCPSCGQEVVAQPAGADPRRVQTRVGQAAWHEPETYCRRCRRAFFPSGPESGD